MPVGEARHTSKIVLVDVAKESYDLQSVCRVPDVVEYTLEVWNIVGESQFANRRVTGLKTEGMRYAVTSEITIVSATEVHMRIRHGALRDEIVHSRIGHGVEIAAKQKWYRGTISVFLGWPGFRLFWLFAIVTVARAKAIYNLVLARRMLCPLVGESFEAFHQDGNLHKFDICESGIPEDVHIPDDESCSSSAIFQEGNDRNIVSRHDAVEDIVFSFHIWPVDGSVGEVDELLVQQYVPVVISISRQPEMSCHSLAVLVEDGTPINKFRVSFRHGPRS